MPFRFAAVAALLIVAGMLGACTYVEELNLPLITERGKPIDLPRPDERRMYPEELPIGDALDIQVTRVGNAIRLDNRTTRRYHDAELWLNRQYGAQIGEVVIGPGPLLSLESFVNHYAEKYPMGGFLDPDSNRPLVLADLVVDGKIHKLVVRLDEDWRQ